MWPYICQLVEKLLRETIEPAVKASDPHLSTFCFSKIDIGDKVSGTRPTCSPGRRYFRGREGDGRCGTVVTMVMCACVAV